MMETYCKILIIDDEFIMRQGMKHMLDWESEGFKIVGEATNGQEGLDLIEKIRPDIVIADIVMPVLDGIEFSEIIRQKYPEIQLIVLSSFDKFEYVKSTLLNGAVDYILKPTLNPEILLKTLNKAVRKIPGMKLVKGNQMSPSVQIEKVLLGYQDKFEEVSFTEVFPYTLFRMCGTNLKQMCRGRKENMARMEEMIAGFFEIQADYVTIPVFLDEEFLYCIYNYRIKDEKKVLADIETCISKAAEIQTETFFVVSKNFSNVQEIKQCYQTELQPLINHGFYYPNRNLLIVEQKPELKKEERFAFENYTTALHHGQFDTAFQMFWEYVQYICGQQVDEVRMKNLTKNLLYNYLIETEKYGVQGESLRNTYFTEIDNAGNVERFQKVMEELRAELEQVQEGKLNVEDEKIMIIKNYINEHLGEDLSLGALADKFGFSYHYLSYYFNKQSKEGFSEYLNRVRIEKACSLLKNGEYSISEISEQVGYSDNTYFSRIFKKMTGETPSNYRRMHRK